MFPVPKHFSDDRRLFAGTFYPYKKKKPKIDIFFTEKKSEHIHGFKIDFTKKKKNSWFSFLATFFGGRNFKNTFEGWYVPKSKKSHFRMTPLFCEKKLPRTISDHQKNVSGPGTCRKSIFAAAFRWIFMPKSPKLMYFWWFSRPRDYFEARAWPCTGAQESKKSKIAKNGLKRTQTIIEVHIKVFWVGPGTVRYHMSQPIFSNFFGFPGG